MLHFAEIFTESLNHAFMITTFILVMMLIVEFFHINTKGNLIGNFRQKPFYQILISAILGLLPGCLGTYAVVTMFTHNAIGWGGLVAAFIASTGDEAFVIFSMVPEAAIKITGPLFLLAIVTGWITYIILKRKQNKQHLEELDFHIHESESTCLIESKDEFIETFKRISFPRSVLIVSLLIFLAGVIVGEFADFHGHTAGHEHHHEHGDWGWVRITFLIVSIVALFVSIFTNNHFIKHHLWEHIIKVHFLRIFVWTFGTLILIGVGLELLTPENWVENNQYWILLIACLIGLIPVSGPHMTFITLFMHGTIPFSILLANSIVQDGHGALPLWAESKKAFLWVKLINFLIGMLFGFIALILGY